MPFHGLVEINTALFLPASTELGAATFNYFFTLMHVQGLIAVAFGLLFKLINYGDRFRA